MTEPCWFYEKNDGVLFSSINISRNIKKTLFPQKAAENQKEHALVFMLDVIKNLSSVFYDEYHDIDLMPKGTYNLFSERHLLPKKMKNTKFVNLCVTKKEDSSILLNHKEHISLRLCHGGLDLYSLYEKTEKIENEMAQSINFAFDKKFGYLTSSARNIGCAMSVSVALTTPMLSFSAKNYLENFYLECQSLGYAASNENGNKPSKNDIIIIKNKNSFGLSEIDIFEGIHYLANTLTEAEIKLRERMHKLHKSFIEDKVFRAQSVLMSAKILSYGELKTLSAWLRLGVFYGIVDIDLYKLNKMLIYLKDAHIEEIVGFESNINESRAAFSKDILKK